MSENIPPPRRLVIALVALVAAGCLWWFYAPASTPDIPLDADGNPINVTLARMPKTVASAMEAHGIPLKVFQDARELDAEARKPEHLSILFIGNSHTEVVPALLAHLLQTHDPQTRVIMARVGGGFLVNHLQRPETRAMIKAAPWDFVILQAQKYSTTGTRTYPIDAALALTKMARTQGAEVLLFPEWSQRGAPDEYLRINRVHQSIAEQTGSPIAPIGQTWATVLEADPKLQLHDDDGNHASLIGHWLNACVFFGMIAEQKVEEKQWLPIPHLNKEQQILLPKQAWDEVQRGLAEDSQFPQQASTFR